jgi:hypothetical protein
MLARLELNPWRLKGTNGRDVRAASLMIDRWRCTESSLVNPPSTTMSITMPQPEQYGGAPPAYTDLDAELVFGSPPLPPPEFTRQHLQLPICLPQITSGYDSPFARAYNPQLSASGIEEDEFLNFLDALNIAMVLIHFCTNIFLMFYLDR